MRGLLQGVQLFIQLRGLVVEMVVGQVELLQALSVAECLPAAFMVQAASACEKLPRPKSEAHDSRWSACWVLPSMQSEIKEAPWLSLPVERLRDQ
eukprot:860094-Amphidinium_carterae.2